MTDNIFNFGKNYRWHIRN